MIIASQKRRDNIAEYLLYMWQIEDIIRAYSLNIERIEHDIITPMQLPDEQHRQVVEWYESLIDMMRREEVTESGHLQINRNVIIQLDDLHRAVMADDRFADYHRAYYSILPLIVELRARAGAEPKGEIETCFNALYGLLMMRLRHQAVSADTASAIERISRFIALLAKYFHLDEAHQLFRDEPQD
ncbi:MAG: DUF4924 family protein [Muribaculaceae bacterium]